MYTLIFATEAAMDQTELIDKYIPRNDVYLYNTGGARKAWLLYGAAN